MNDVPTAHRTPDRLLTFVGLIAGESISCGPVTSLRLLLSPSGTTLAM